LIVKLILFQKQQLEILKILEGIKVKYASQYNSLQELPWGICTKCLINPYIKNMFNKNNHLKVYVAAGDSFASTGSSEIKYEKTL